MKTASIAFLSFVGPVLAASTASALENQECRHWLGKWVGEWRTGNIGKTGLNIKKVDEECNTQFKYAGRPYEGKIENGRLQFLCAPTTAGTCAFTMSSDRTELSATYSNPFGGLNSASFSRKAKVADE